MNSGDPILTKAEKFMAAWEVFRASAQRQPLPLYCNEHNKWERRHDEVSGAWGDAWRDLVATQPTTRRGAVALIHAFLLISLCELSAPRPGNRAASGQQNGDQAL